MSAEAGRKATAGRCPWCAGPMVPEGCPECSATAWAARYASGRKATGRASDCTDPEHAGAKALWDPKFDHCPICSHERTLAGREASDVRPWDEQDEAVLRAVDAVRAVDNLDYSRLFDYQDDQGSPPARETST